MRATKIHDIKEGSRQMRKGIYLEIENAPSNADFLVSDEMQKDVGFSLFSREVTQEHNISVYRMIGYWCSKNTVDSSNLIRHDFRIATEEEKSRIEKAACYL